MALAVEASGTQAATIGTEHSLSAPTSSAIRVLRVDTGAMVAGEVVEISIKTKVLTGGTQRSIYLASIGGGTAQPIVASPPVTMPFGGEFTLKQVNGTGRSFPWSVETL